MSELGPNMRALLDRAREGMSPDAAALHRVRLKVGASVAGTAGGMSLAAKLLISLVATGGLVGTVVAVRASQSPSTIEQTPAVSLQLHPDEVAPMPIAQSAPETSPPPAAAPIVVRPVVVAPPPPPPTQPPPPPPPPAPTPHATLSREVELVDSAMSQVRHGNFDSALATLRIYTDETAGRGQLAEDASAIEVEASCRLKSPTAAARFDAFDREWPLSAQRARLVEACK